MEVCNMRGNGLLCWSCSPHTHAFTKWMWYAVNTACPATVYYAPVKWNVFMTRIMKDWQLMENPILTTTYQTDPIITFNENKYGHIVLSQRSSETTGFKYVCFPSISRSRRCEQCAGQSCDGNHDGTVVDNSRFHYAIWDIKTQLSTSEGSKQIQVCEVEQNIYRVLFQARCD